MEAQNLAREVFEWQQANDRHVIERDEALAKLARIEALCNAQQEVQGGWVAITGIHAILRGEA